MNRNFLHTLAYIVVLLILLGACQKTTKTPETPADKIDISEEPSLEEFSKVEDYNAKKEAKPKAVKKKGKESQQERSSDEANDIKKVTKEGSKPISSKPKAKKPKRKYGVIKFDSTLYRLPAMTEGEKVSLDFGFTNEGEAPLQILTAEVTCGCTTPNIPFLDIQPGDRGKISIDYNSVNKYGHQAPEIVVTTNGKPKKVVLKVSVEILEREKIDTTKIDTLSN